MGADLQILDFKPCSKAELEKKWAEAQDDAGHEHGHGGYSGSIYELNGGLDFRHTQVFNSRQEAHDYISEHHPKWDSAFAVQFRKGEATERSKNKREALYQKKELMYKKVCELERSLIEDFKNAKSATAGCKHCGSKLNRKFVHNATCICGKNLLSDTAQNRLKALKEKQKAAMDEFNNFKPEVSHNGELWWACGGWCSC